MKLYSGILVCDRDNDLAKEHVRGLAEWGEMEHCLYYGMDQHPVEGLQYHIVGIHELYENLPMKTYCMFKHALERPWTHLLKTDVNARVHSIRWDVVREADLTGFLSVSRDSRIGKGVRLVSAGRILPPQSVTQPALLEEYRGPQSERWVGGPAYIVSRRLAELVVGLGIWQARAFAAEDIMVSTVAQHHGMRIEAGLGYISDSGVLDVNRWGKGT